ncbi:MAG TPA: monovalent cation/H(+) antiporter subunit G [Thermodesulfobacteriota bacterium]|nr:monovalent cation/H(+) antiporter subunit G [Thermodesulfobacteriota bacterium]
MEIRAILAGILIFAGCFLIVVASIGIVRFPDFYSRMHPAGKTDTMGQGLVLFGLMVYEGFSFVSVKLLFIIIFIFVVNPTATHALAKAAYVAGIRPWQKGDKRN